MSDAAHVQGADQLVSTLRDAARDLAQLDATDQQAAELLADTISRTAPRRTGYLAEHVTASSGHVVVGAPYAVYVNARNPWVSRALDAQADDVAEIYAERVTDVLAQVGGS